MATRQGEVVAIVFADHTDTILRVISPSWLVAGWQVACEIARDEGLDVSRFGWGWLHSGVAALPYRADSALDHFGFSSDEMLGWSDERLARCTARLAAQPGPCLRVGGSYRGEHHDVAPSDGAFGMRLVELSMTDACDEWLGPAFYETQSSDVPLPHIARALSLALAARDAAAVESALSLAERHYSREGFQIGLAALRRFVQPGTRGLDDPSLQTLVPARWR